MTIALRGVGQEGSRNNGNDVTLTFNVSPLEDDVVVVFGGHGEDITSLAAPTGYTQIGIHTGTIPIFGAWYKKMTSSPDSTVVGSGGGDAQDGVAYCCWVLSGVDPDTPIDVTTTTAGPTAGENPDGAAITPTTAGAWVLSMSGSSNNDSTPGTLSLWSNIIDKNGNDTNDLTCGGGTFPWVTGALNPPAWSTWITGTWYSITAALRPAPVSGRVMSSLAGFGGLAGAGGLAGTGGGLAG